MHNKRIVTETLEDGCLGIRIDIKDNLDQPRTKHLYKRGRATTLIKLTKEACEALIIGLTYELNKGNNEKTRG